MGIILQFGDMPLIQHIKRVKQSRWSNIRIFKQAKK